LLCSTWTGTTTGQGAYAPETNYLLLVFVKFVENNVMGTAELRKVVRSYIDKADERFLRMVDAMRKEYEGSDIVGYEVDGTPITQEELKLRAKEASSEVKAGNYITQEELEKEIENW